MENLVLQKQPYVWMEKPAPAYRLYDGPVINAKFEAYRQTISGWYFNLYGRATWVEGSREQLIMDKG